MTMIPVFCLFCSAAVQSTNSIKLLTHILAAISIYKLYMWRGDSLFLDMAPCSIFAEDISHHSTFLVLVLAFFIVSAPLRNLSIWVFLRNGCLYWTSFEG